MLLPTVHFGDALQHLPTAPLDADTQTPLQQLAWLNLQHVHKITSHTSRYGINMLHHKHSKHPH